MLRTRLVLSFLAAVVVTLAAAPPALAGGAFKEARFTARISGTYTANGSVTNTSCFHATGDSIVPFTGMGASSERTSFHSTRGALLGIIRLAGDRRIIAAGDLPVTVSMTRASSLDSPDEPQGCRPTGAPTDRPNCGHRTKSFHLGPYGVRNGFGLTYNLVRGHFLAYANDPFVCPAVEGVDWWGAYGLRGNGTGPVSPARVFNRRIHTIIVRGAVTKSPHTSSASEGVTISATETLRWTLTLTRRG